MNFYSDLSHRLFSAKDESTQIDIIRLLPRFQSESQIVKELCWIATQTDSYRLTQAVINKLRAHAEAANQYFKRYADQNEHSDIRRRAIICLGLMGCTTAKDVVLRGLRAKSPSVRLAASINIGLYHDQDILNAFDYFFEHLCFGISPKC